jgi:hypothetical protein
VADLVSLINRVLSGAPRAPMALGGEGLTAGVESSFSGGRLTLSCESDFAIGGALVTITTPAAVTHDAFENVPGGMMFDYRQEGGLLKVLVYSMGGVSLPSGRNEFLTINGIQNYEIEAVDLASADGRRVTVVLGAARDNVPGEFALHQNYPNPFNPETQIAFDLPQAGRVELTVYNVLGRRIVTLAGGTFEAGSHSVSWDGRDESGTSVSSGVYFYRLETPSGSVSRKMVLLK